MTAETEHQKRLRRIENGIATLIKIIGYSTRNAWDGVSWEEREKLMEQQEQLIDDAVEGFMENGPRKKWR